MSTTLIRIWYNSVVCTCRELVTLTNFGADMLHLSVGGFLRKKYLRLSIILTIFQHALCEAYDNDNMFSYVLQ